MAYFIGLMSGTSMDGVDAVLCDIDQGRVQTLDAFSQAYPDNLLSNLHSLCQPGADEINTQGKADVQVARVFAQAVEQLLAQTGLEASAITAIGSHGQTIRHAPPTADDTGFTLQIGDANTLAALTGIDVVADFRRKDMALGGHGAPLAPGFHQAVFRAPDQHRAIVNIGGIANVTWLPATTSSDPVIGFDTGPGNTLMDAWCLQHTGQPYDDNGQWAKSGQVSKDLLSKLLSDPYFALPYPKSTGREYFHSRWLNSFIDGTSLAASDIQATLLALTVQSICQALQPLPPVSELYVCGGGAYNSELMQSLQTAMPGVHIATTQALELAPQWVEGAAFAWLAWAHLNRVPGNLPSVTGASREAILGGHFPAK